MFGSPTASRPPQTLTLGGSEERWYHPPPTSEFVGMTSSAPTVSHELPDNEGKSDGSSIGDVAFRHHPSWKCAMVDGPAQPPVVAESTQTHTPLDTRAEALAPAQAHDEELRQ